MKHCLAIFFLLALNACLAAATGDIETRLLSPSVLVGETTQLLIRIEGTERAFIGDLPENADLDLKLLETTSPARGSIRDTLFRLSIRPLREGEITIPEIPVEILGQEKRTSPIPITSLSPTTISWATANVQEFEVEYGTRWSIGKSELYAGESTPVTLHVYLPRLAGSAKLAYPRDRSTGLAVTPLLPNDPYKPGDQPSGQTLLRGRNYDVFAFSATATAIAGGQLSLGPATAPAIIKVRRTESIQERNFSLETSLPIPAVDLRGLAFPETPPPGFDGAIGNFDISAKIGSDDLTPGAPVELELTVNGEGNFTDLPAPKLKNPGDWKIASIRRLGSKKSRAKPPARFQYLITHPATPPALPVLELVGFSPESGKFNITSTPQIPLRWSGTTSPANLSPTLAPKGDRLKSDPFAPIATAPTSPLYEGKSSMPFWWSGAVAVAASLPLFVLAGMGLIRRHRLKHPESILIDKMRRIPMNLETREYLHQLGGLLEEACPQANRPKEAQHIINLRNHHCYTPEKSELKISKSERREWIKKISSALSALVIFALNFSSQADAAPNSPTSDELTNRGSSYATEQNWPLAARCYRQALAADPNNQEAQSRLDLVHQSANTLLPPANAWKSSLGNFRKSTYLKVTIISLFAGLYFVLLPFAVGRNQKVGIALSLACLVLCAFAFHTHQNYPYHYSVTELGNRAILKDDSPLHLLPLASSEMTHLPAATPVVINARRTPWLHVECADLKTFWVKEDEVLPLDQSPP